MPRPAITLAAGLLVCGVMLVLLTDAEVPSEEIPWALGGLAWLVSPYVLLACLAGGAKRFVWATVLLVLLATTAGGAAAVLSSESSTAALLFIWLIPLQFAVAGATALPVLRRGQAPPVR